MGSLIVVISGPAGGDSGPGVSWGRKAEIYPPRPPQLCYVIVSKVLYFQIKISVFLGQE